MAAVMLGVAVRDAGGLQIGVQLPVGLDEGIVTAAIEAQRGQRPDPLQGLRQVGPDS